MAQYIILSALIFFMLNIVPSFGLGVDTTKNSATLEQRSANIGMDKVYATLLEHKRPALKTTQPMVLRSFDGKDSSVTTMTLTFKNEDEDNRVSMAETSFRMHLQATTTLSDARSVSSENRKGTWQSVDAGRAYITNGVIPLQEMFKQSNIQNNCTSKICPGTRVGKKTLSSLNKRLLTLPSVLYNNTNLRSTGRKPRNPNFDVANEIEHKEVLDESRRWHIGTHQLHGIKRPKRTPAHAAITTSMVLSYRQHCGRRSTGFDTFDTKRYVHRRRNGFGHGGSGISRSKREASARDDNNGVPRYTKRLPNSEEVYKRLQTLDVVFLMPLNMTMNVTDSNATSDGLDKCMKLLGELYINVEDDGKLYCNSSWDKVSCWPMTLAGTIASVPCPGYLTGISDSNNATKYCYENGTWADKAIYNFCLGSSDIKVKTEDEHGPAIRIIYNVGFTVSTLALVIALFIFLYFRSLRCLRNRIHCHLIVTFIDTNIIWIVTRHSLLFLQNPDLAWLCKTLISVYRFSHATNFFWMFVEGLYLHIIIVWTYSADKIKLRYLVAIGWGLPAVNLVIWIVLRLEFANDHCWLPFHDVSIYDYVMIGPILLVLLINIIFLSTIVWVLITKLRASHTLETRQYRKAVRATIILFPLLGITYVLFIMPPRDHPQVKVVFNYINAILQSFQGLLVAIFYCFLNGEVKTVLKKKFSRYHDARSLSTKYTKSSVMGYYGNTTTYGNTNGGTVGDQTRRLNGSLDGNQPENIPLRITRDVEEEMD